MRALEAARGELGPPLRRLLHHGFLLAALLVAASGVTLLVTHALPAPPRPPGLATRDLARGLSATLVGVPVWLALRRAIRRRLARDPGERGSPAWPLYLTAASTVALVVGLANLVRVGAWAVGSGDYEAGSVAAALVWTAAWGLHAWLARHGSLAPAGPLAGLVALAGAAVGLVALVAGAAGVVSFGLGQVYRAAVWGALAEAVTTETLRRDLVLTLLAAAAWWWHWLRSAAGGPRTTLWHAHVVLLGILGGLLGAAAGVTVALHAALRWFLSASVAAGSASHFEILPAAATAMAVGGWSWWYHRSVLAEGERRRTEPERAYEYLVAAVGLVAATAGAASAVVASVQAGAAPPGAPGAGGRQSLVVALTLLAVGAPLWGLYWRRLQRRAGSAGGAERGSPSRRAYLFLVLGGAGVAATAGVARMLFVLFRDLLEGALGAGSVHAGRVGLALSLTAGGVAGYHWRVYREDRARLSSGAARPRTVLLVTPGEPDLAERLAARTGAAVRTLHRVDGGRPEGGEAGERAPGGDRAGGVDEEALVAAVLASPHPRLLVVVGGDGAVRVIPYEPA